MALKDRLMEELKVSMKTKDAIRKSVITLIRSSIKQYEVDNRVEADEDKVVELISKRLKQSKDALVEFEKAQREDLIEQTKQEIKILESYLPSQMSYEEVEKIVIETIKEIDASSIKDMGKVMSAVMPKVKGRTEGKVINEIAKKHL